MKLYLQRRSAKDGARWLAVIDFDVEHLVEVAGAAVHIAQFAESPLEFRITAPYSPTLLHWTASRGWHDALAAVDGRCGSCDAITAGNRALG